VKARVKPEKLLGSDRIL